MTQRPRGDDQKGSYNRRMGTIWISPGSEPRLDEGTVHVWRFSLADPGTEPLLRRAHAVLSEDELARAGRLRVESARAEFMAARGLLRLRLGALLGQAPEGLRFEVGPQGKPRLADGRGVEFNVTHARGCLVLAVSRAGPVGVDVEPLDRAVEALELARTHFHPEELALIRAELDDERRAAVFFRCWTRKEAVVKADGRGLQVPLDGFCVLPHLHSAQEDAHSGTLQVSVPGGGSLWVRDLQVGGGFVGALAVQTRGVSVQYLESRARAGE